MAYVPAYSSDYNLKPWELLFLMVMFPRFAQASWWLFHVQEGLKTFWAFGISAAPSLLPPNYKFR